MRSRQVHSETMRDAKRVSRSLPKLLLLPLISCSSLTSALLPKQNPMRRRQDIIMRIFLIMLIIGFSAWKSLSISNCRNRDNREAGKGSGVCLYEAGGRGRGGFAERCSCSSNTTPHTLIQTSFTHTHTHFLFPQSFSSSFPDSPSSRCLEWNESLRSNHNNCLQSHGCLLLFFLPPRREVTPVFSLMLLLPLLPLLLQAGWQESNDFKCSPSPTKKTL